MWRNIVIKIYHYVLIKKFKWYNVKCRNNNSSITYKIICIAYALINLPKENDIVMHQQFYYTSAYWNKTKFNQAFCLLHQECLKRIHTYISLNIFRKLFKRTSCIICITSLPYRNKKDAQDSLRN